MHASWSLKEEAGGEGWPSAAAGTKTDAWIKKTMMASEQKQARKKMHLERFFSTLENPFRSLARSLAQSASLCFRQGAIKPSEIAWTWKRTYMAPVPRSMPILINDGLAGRSCSLYSFYMSPLKSQTNLQILKCATVSRCTEIRGKGRPCHWTGSAHKQKWERQRGWNCP